jgi:hypothetical protein
MGWKRHCKKMTTSLLKNWDNTAFDFCASKYEFEIHSNFPK